MEESTQGSDDLLEQDTRPARKADVPSKTRILVTDSDPYGKPSRGSSKLPPRERMKRTRPSPTRRRLSIITKEDDWEVPAIYSPDFTVRRCVGKYSISGDFQGFISLVSDSV